MLRTKFACLSVFLLYFQVLALQGQEIDGPENAISGHCYAQCLLPLVLDTIQEKFPLYVGPSDSTILFSEISFSFLPDGHMDLFDDLPEPERARSQKAFPKDPMMLSIITEPDSVDQSLINWIDLARLVIIEEESIGWEEVCCRIDQSKILWSRLRGRLSVDGYLEKPRSSRPADLFRALENYQRDHGLPIGHLNIKTLKAMEIKY